MLKNQIFVPASMHTSVGAKDHTYLLSFSLQMMTVVNDSIQFIHNISGLLLIALLIFLKSKDKFIDTERADVH